MWNRPQADRLFRDDETDILANRPLPACRQGNGNLYAVSQGSNEVKRYDGRTGAFIDTFAAGAGISGPFDLTFGPDGNLYLSCASNRIKRFNGTTGAFIDTFVASGSGGLRSPQDLLFSPSVTPPTVPEPSSLILFLTSLAIFLLLGRKRSTCDKYPVRTGL